MEITRDVILDLLPLYLAGEVSADTRALVENYVKTDPELAHLVERSVAIELSKDIPVPLTQEDKMEAYREAQRLIFRRIAIWAAVISLVVVIVIIGIVLLIFFAVPS
jgi:anti-sigma factor RsiW